MTAARLARFAGWLAGLWAGAIAATGFVAAPTLFAVLPRADAGRVAARLFQIDANVGLAAGVILLILATRGADAVRPAGSSRFSVEPMIEAARRGEGGPSFAVLHGVGSVFFVAKFLAVAVLAWRLTARRGAATSAAPTS